MKTGAAYRVLMFANSDFRKWICSKASNPHSRELADAKLRERPPDFLIVTAVSWAERQVHRRLLRRRRHFPCVSRIDDLKANRMGLAFTRIRTLADGDTCCNISIAGPGFTELAPEEGFESRK